MIRLFVAVELPQELRARIGMMCTGIDSAKWVAVDNLHLTLSFLGELPEDRAEDIAGALSSVGGAPFPLTMGGAGHFGSGRRVRALWLGVERCPALSALRDRIESTLVRAGLPPEGRKFHPHVTVARFGDVSPGWIRDWLSANTLFRAAPFTIERFVLFSSHLRRGGAIYTPEMEFPLRG